MHLPFTENHISYSAQDRVKEILSPLCQMADIHYFNYSVTYPDKSGFTLHTNEKLYESWYLKQFPFWEFRLKSGWYLWDNIDSIEKSDYALNLGIANGIMLIEHKQDKTEVIAFASTPENNKVMQFYINQKLLLKQFKKHFIEQAHDLIDIANSQLVQTPDSMMGDEILAQQVRLSKPKCNPDLNSPFEQLSVRERECCELLLKGNSLETASLQLGLALPTVANYVCRAKEKLSVSNRAELFKLAQKWGYVLCANVGNSL
jgi:DNA-binding CsgD family transcriptional regulator